ncbi:MAG: insulinase family protein [Muribaculaceae bacterium]|nr:insulinase family protein [Muribaculaceae bacterium]
MKRILLFGLLCLTAMLLAEAQTSPALQVQELELSNGMKVWLNVDHSQPKVFGAVVVNAGSIDCPDTGIAHYFEHIMFKGTDELGTVDYAAEKVYLDSISMKYDELSRTTDVKQRKALQHDINELNVKASKYAIPNEFNRLITKYGGSDLNAGTSYDFTFYHNTFSPQFIEQWCELNSHRLIHPVFRLFQGELETVYEEKNMYSDDPGSMMLEQISGKFFAGTPYAYPIIGSTESLKNPRQSDMEAFYKKYYVASNMGLVLSGDIDPATIMPLLERTFGRLERGVKPVREKITPPAIVGQPEEKFFFPMPLIGMSAMLFRGPTDYDADAPAMKVALALLSNDNKTGLLDELTNKNRVYLSMPLNMGMNQASALAVMVVPKLFCKVKTAENLCLEQIEKLKNGDFTDEQLQAVKKSIARDNEKGMESITERSQLMVAAMSAGVKWEDFMRLNASVGDITREDVTRVARKYFTDNYYRFHKKNGRVPVEQIAKPEYTPAKPQHSGDKSAFAQRLEQIPVQDVAPRLLDFDRDVEKVKMQGGNMLYAGPNPLNNAFTLIINFHKGTLQDNRLEAAADYVTELGTDSLEVKDFGAAMQRLGAKMVVSSDEQATSVMLRGEDVNLEETLRLLGHFLDRMKADEDKLESIKDAAGPEEKSFWDENTQVFAALAFKVARGERSSYLTHLTAKELKKLKAADLIAAFKSVYDYRCDISYSGKLPAARVADLLSAQLPQVKGTQENPMQDIQLETPQSRTVYVFDLPKSRQTIIGLYRPLKGIVNDRDKACLEMWGEYFGGGMSSVLFQEVREFRSMAYASQGVAMTPSLAHSSAPCGYLSLVATQADKSMQALTLLDSLVNDMPVNVENMSVARQSLLNDINNSYPTYRGKPLMIALSERMGYTADRNTAMVEQLPALTQQDIEDFYARNIKNQPYQLMVVGNLKKLDLKALAKYGTIVKVKKEDIYRTKPVKK